MFTQDLRGGHAALGEYSQENKRTRNGDNEMNHPYETNINANLKYSKMLNDAEAHRQAKRINAVRPSFFKVLVALFTRNSKAERIETSKSTARGASTTA